MLTGSLQSYRSHSVETSNWGSSGNGCVLTKQIYFKIGTVLYIAAHLWCLNFDQSPALCKRGFGLDCFENDCLSSLFVNFIVKFMWKVQFDVIWSVYMIYVRFLLYFETSSLLHTWWSDIKEELQCSYWCDIHCSHLVNSDCLFRLWHQTKIEFFIMILNRIVYLHVFA